MSETTTLNPGEDVWEAMRIDDVSKAAGYFSKLCGEQGAASVVMGENEFLVLSHEADPGVPGFRVLLAVHQFGEGMRPDKKAPMQEERFVVDSSGVRLVGYGNYDWATYSALGDVLLDLNLESASRSLGDHEQAKLSNAQNARAEIKFGTAEHALPIHEFDDIMQSDLARKLSDLLHRAALARRILQGDEEHNSQRRS